MELNSRRLKIEMAKKCWTTADLAEMSGVSVNAIRMLMNHPERKAQTKTIGKLAKALEVEPVEILILEEV